MTRDIPLADMSAVASYFVGEPVTVRLVPMPRSKGRALRFATGREIWIDPAKVDRANLAHVLLHEAGHFVLHGDVAVLDPDFVIKWEHQPAGTATYKSDPAAQAAYDVKELEVDLWANRTLLNLDDHWRKTRNITFSDYVAGVW